MNGSGTKSKSTISWSWALKFKDLKQKKVLQQLNCGGHFFTALIDSG